MYKGIFFLAVIAIIVAGASFFSGNAGVVVAEFSGVEFETSVAFLLSFVGVFCLLSFFFGQIISYLRGAPKRLASWRHQKRQKDGVDAVVSALQFLKMGDDKHSEQLATKAEKLLDDKRLPLYLKAEVSAMKGDLDVAEESYLALENNADTALIGQLGLLNVYSQKSSHEALKVKALAILKASSTNLMALNALWHANLHLGQYAEALKLVPKMRRLGSQGAEFLDMAVASIYVRQAKQSIPESPKDAEKLLKKALTSRASFAPAVLQLASLYQTMGKQTSAEKALHTFLLHTMNEDVLTAWLAIVDARKPKSWAKVFAKLEETYSTGYEGATINALCLEKQGNRAQAQAVLIKHCNAQPNGKMYLWLARLEDEMAGKVGAGYTFMQDALTADNIASAGSEDSAFYINFVNDYKTPTLQLAPAQA